MKHSFTYILLLVTICLASCSKSTPVQTNPVPTPSGTFGGFFQLVHTTVKTGLNDTVSCNLTLLLDGQGNFTVTGDTSTYHAGSKGKFSLGIGDDLVFTDNTSNKLFPKKAHLNGDYKYEYNGSVLGLDKNVGDSLSYQYYFTKSSN
jgi:hypothetical protein